MKKVTCAFALLLVVSLLLTLPVFSASAETYILGDADGDGEVTSIDATIMQRCIVFLYGALDHDPADYLPEGTDVKGLAREISRRSDVDGDGDLTIIDVTLVMRYLADLKVKYPVGKKIIPTQPATEAPTQPKPTQLEPTQPKPTQPIPTAKPDPYELPPI